jgi:hypothetical protein
MKRHPAYGKQFIEARKRGLIPMQRMVYIVFSWGLAKAFPRLVVDPVADFGCMDFSYLAGLDVIIGFRQVEEALVDPLAAAILKAIPRRLQACPLDPDIEGRYPTRYFKIAEAE